MLTKDNFFPKLHLKQPGFTYSACCLFTKHRESIQKFKGTGYLNFMMLHMVIAKIYVKQPVSDKILKDRAYEIAINPEYDEYKRGLRSMFYVFYKKTESGQTKWEFM